MKVLHKANIVSWSDQVSTETWPWPLPLVKLALQLVQRQSAVTDTLNCCMY